MSKPLISIVTPSYGKAEFIQDTILSVKNQTYENVEHIIVDGGSDDGTVEILEQYENQYNLEWISEDDDGQSDAVNKGFEIASGAIVGWINADDVYFDTGVLERVQSYFTEYNHDVIYGDVALFDRYSRVYKILSSADFDYELTVRLHLSRQPQVFFRNAVAKNNKLDADLQYSMDYEFWLRLADNYSFKHVNDVFAGFRKYAEQKTTGSRGSSKSEVERVSQRYRTPSKMSSRLKFALKYIRYKTSVLVRSLRHIWGIQSDPPELAFDGEIVPMRDLLRNRVPEPLLPTEQHYIE